MQRRTKSLQDALQALALAMQEAAEGAGHARGGGGARAGAGGDEDNELRGAAKQVEQLSKSLSERDDVVTNLREANKKLGRKVRSLAQQSADKPQVIELEERLKELEDPELP